MANIITIPEGSIPYLIDLDLKDNNGHEKLRFEQYDTNSRYIKCTLYKDGLPFLLTDSHIVTFSCTKPHTKYGVNNECWRDASGNLIYIVSEQTTAEDGLFKGQFTIYDTYIDDSTTVSRRIGTPTFPIYVEKAALDDNTIISTNEFNVLTNMITTIGDLITDANKALVDMNTALQAEVIRVSSENTRITNENLRIQHDSVRPVWNYVTQSQYNALSDADKNDPLKIWQITDNADSLLVNELSNLLGQINSALEAVEAITTTINNINDGSVSTVQAWSSDRIAKNIRTAEFTATSTTSTITHNLTYNPTFDDMLVTCNGVVLDKDENYTDNPDLVSITLSGWSINSGDKVKFRLLRYAKYI